MDKMMRKHVERALRVADFARQHPSDLPGHTTALTRLEVELGRVAEVAQEETATRRSEMAAIAERKELGDQLAAELQMLAGIARVAGTESVGTPIVLKYPGPRKNLLQFLDGARTVVATAKAQEELLVKFGLPAGHLESLSAGLDRFAGLVSARDAAGRAHVGARVQIRSVARNLKLIVEQMHTINRFRYRKDAALMAMWRTSRDLRVATRKATVEEGPTTGPLALPPGPNDLRPAA